MDAVEPVPQGRVSYWVVPMSSARHAVCAARRRQADRSWPPQDCRGTTGVTAQRPPLAIPVTHRRSHRRRSQADRYTHEQVRSAVAASLTTVVALGEFRDRTSGGDPVGCCPHLSPPRHRPRLQAGLGTRLTDPQPCRRRADAVMRAADHSNAAFSPGSSLGRAGREGAVPPRRQHTGQARGGASAWGLERSPPYDAQVVPGIHTRLKRVCSMRCRPCRRGGNRCYR
jgi:hypothetical protein